MFRHLMIPLRQFPQLFPIVTGILTIQIVVYCVIVFSGETASWEQFGVLVPWRIDAGEYWRLFFSLLVHDHIFQLLIISVMLYVFGPPLEWLYGKMSFIILFFGVGIIGNWMIYFLGISNIYMGAFECLYGLFGVYLYLYWQRMIHPEIVKMVLVLFAINFVLNLQLWLVHLTAVLAGFILGMMLMEWKRFRFHSKKGDGDDQ